MMAGLGCSLDASAVRLSYLPMLRDKLTKPLQEDGQDGIEGVVSSMHAYCLAKWVDLLVWAHQLPLVKMSFVGLACKL